MSIPESSDSDEESLLVEQINKKASTFEIEEIEEEDISTAKVNSNKLDDKDYLKVPETKEFSNIANNKTSIDDQMHTDTSPHVDPKVNSSTTCHTLFIY